LLDGVVGDSQRPVLWRYGVSCRFLICPEEAKSWIQAEIEEVEEVSSNALTYVPTAEGSGRQEEGGGDNEDGEVEREEALVILFDYKNIRCFESMMGKTLHGQETKTDVGLETVIICRSSCSPVSDPWFINCRGGKPSLPLGRPNTGSEHIQQA
jgi:hypothetical protein